jgi:hypothetical protein
MRFDFLKSKWLMVAISFLVGSLFTPLPGKIEDIIIKKFFERSETSLAFTIKIKSIINKIVNSANKVNQDTAHYRKIVCEKLYHKKYKGIPCYSGPVDGSPNKKAVGEIYLRQTGAYIVSYEQSLLELQSTLDISTMNYPELKPVLNKLNKWIIATSKNCWFPTNEYYIWQNIILHQIDNRIPFDAKSSDDILQRAIILGAPGFPANCSGYSSTNKQRSSEMKKLPVLMTVLSAFVTGQVLACCPGDCCPGTVTNSALSLLTKYDRNFSIKNTNQTEIVKQEIENKSSSQERIKA